ncbi:urea amidolyase associated protein UAAP2 [Glycomyces salinus]|uniref:urea amidolyase associated protein UAAP2 n=1 Tax=Glycomyces salinus TaxID=980294 RepID=UPI0018ED74BB|nr:urea amidolyase associated protein UAAP2 [Glycomyces salinus]
MSAETVSETVVPARAPWSGLVRAGQFLSIVDLGGNQAVDFLLYDAADTDLRYSAQNTVAAAGALFLTTGSVLRDVEHRPMATVTADDCGRHDTIGGACSKESNTLRYGHQAWGQHACVENFLHEGARWGLGKRDLTGNVNWFMNVPVEDDGCLGIVDGLSAPGLQVTMRAERDLIALISNCPQINNPCNAFDPTPVKAVVTAADRATEGGGRA